MAATIQGAIPGRLEQDQPRSGDPHAPNPHASLLLLLLIEGFAVWFAVAIAESRTHPPALKPLP